MLSALLVGIMFGLSAGFSPGPLTTLIFTQTLRHNAKEGVLVAAAPVLTDMPIILVSFFIIRELTGIGPVLGIIAVAGGLYVLYLSYETIRTSPVKSATSESHPNSLRKGVIVNALNPHPYLFWITVGMPFILKTQQENPILPWLFLISFYSFLIGSKVSIAFITSKFRPFLEGKIYLYLMRILGVILAGFAVILFKDALVYFELVQK